jgi:hypothetical protein
MSNATLTLLVSFSSIVQGIGTIFVAAAFFLSRRQVRLMSADVHQTRLDTARAETVSQMAQYQGALQLMFDWRSELIANPALAASFSAEPFFAEAFKILPEQEYFHTVKLFHIFEHIWLLNSRQIIHNDMWEPWSHNIVLLMRQKKKRELWKLLKDIGIFNRTFVQFVDKAVKELDDKEKKAPGPI